MPWELCKELNISRSSWTYHFGLFCLVCCLVLFGYYYLDTRLASIVAEIIGIDLLFSRDLSRIPDLVLLTVCIVTVLGWGCHFYIIRMKPAQDGADFYEFIGCSVPLAFCLKVVLKFVFGRTSTRLWLTQTQLSGMHWFHGTGDFTGFPSGHMIVFTSLMLAIGRYFPQYRFLCLGFLSLLGMALVVGEFHFFSDVVAGAYVGFFVDRFTHKALSFSYRSTVD
jgi:membrane-associated phospholipid phosphatase